jgi:outer membrane protein assembly factor BamB
MLTGVTRRSSGSYTLQSSVERIPFVMNLKVAKTFALGIIVLAGTACAAASAEDMKITRQIILSPTHKVAPYSITRAANGDLIIAGADNVGTYHAWATRVSKSGEPIWEYLDGPADAWTDYSQNSQQFYSAAELRNGNTLLCGIKRGTENRRLVAFLVRIAADGKLIDERFLQPAHDGMPIGGMTCIAWDNGVMVLSGLAVVPRGTGWLTRLDADGNVLWERFGDQYSYLDVMSADNGGLFMIGGDEVIKIDADGNLLTRHSLPGSRQIFLHSAGPPTRVRIAAILSTLKTVIIDFDLNLKEPPHTTHLHNIDTNRGLYSGDGVATLFGIRYVGYFNQPTAGAARIYKNGDSKGFTLEPRFQSSWFEDAVPTDSSGREFATVRFTETGVLAWISFK